MRTVNDLIEILQELAEDGYGECRIVAAYQPNYPLVGEIDGVIPPEEEDDEDGDPEVTEGEGRKEGVVHVLVGHTPRGMSPYASKRLWEG
jgi:hypothetical protein